MDENGCFTPGAGPNLEGKAVLGDGNAHVMSALRKFILKEEEYEHSYPYDWRTKEPVIIRASLQWFFDTDSIKAQALVL